MSHYKGERGSAHSKVGKTLNVYLSLTNLKQIFFLSKKKNLRKLGKSDNWFCISFRTLRIFWNQKLNLVTFVVVKWMIPMYQYILINNIFFFNLIIRFLQVGSRKKTHFYFFTCMLNILVSTVDARPQYLFIELLRNYYMCFHNNYDLLVSFPNLCECILKKYSCRSIFERIISRKIMS